MSSKTYFSPSDHLRKCFIESLAADLKVIGHQAHCERNKEGIAFRFSRRENLSPKDWHSIYLKIRNRSLREDTQEATFIRAQEANGITKLFLDGEELRIDAIDPELVIVNQNEDRFAYRYCRHMQSVPTSEGVGRRIMALVYDRGQVRRVLIGAFCLSSVIFSQGLRDQHLGWSRIDSRQQAERIRGLGLKRMMQLSVCVPVPPYNKLHAMKLLALLSFSDPIRDLFHQKYRSRQPLLAVVTTSAFGPYATGFDRIQLKKLIVAGQERFERNELFKPIRAEAVGLEQAMSQVPTSTMIVSQRTADAARRMVSNIFKEEFKEEKVGDPIRGGLNRDRVIHRALQLCNIPRNVLAVNEKGVYFGVLHDSHIEALKEGIRTDVSLRLPLEAIVDYWRKHVVTKATRQPDFVAELQSVRSEEKRLGRILSMADHEDLLR